MGAQPVFPSRRLSVFDLANGLLMLAVCLITLFPIYYVVVISLTDSAVYTTGEVYLFPPAWSLDAYAYLFSTDIVFSSIQVSVFLATVGTVISLIVTSGLSYAISRKRFPGRRAIMLIVLITLLFHPGIIPNYLVVKELGLINSLWALILPALTSGWYVLLMKGFFDGIPESLQEAAEIDGCSDLRIWFQIVLPLSPSDCFMPSVIGIHFFRLFSTSTIIRNGRCRCCCKICWSIRKSPEAAPTLMSQRCRFRTIRSKWPPWL
jgi:putative aldouronate transport system permease protein